MAITKNKNKKSGKVPKLRIKKDDLVYVLAGKDRGEIGRVLSVDPEKRRAVIEGINIHKKHRKEVKTGGGGITDIPAPIDISNLVVVCPHCKTQMRPNKKTVEKTREGVTKLFRVRKCRKCGEQLDQI